MAAQPAPAPAPADDLIELKVDGKTVRVAKGSNLLQACEAAGVSVPRFCYHERLSIAGNCRMCLVEVEKSPKPVASCAMPAGPGMVVKTTTPQVLKAREGVLEFLLINHPLDCPICDQGGECDLQDQTMVFGSDRSRFTEVKRGVVDKDLGPLVKTVMTRCIHCMRCVRFAKEVAGVEDLGVTGRGRDSEVGTYVRRSMTSELSANVVDLCPVGALTAKPTAFTYRSWELSSAESVDVSDALGSAIRVDARGAEVVRVLPREHQGINQEWISDKARFQCDALKYQRLDAPLVRGADGQFKEATWGEALQVAAAALKRDPRSARGVAGRLADAESMILLKDLLNGLGSNDTRSDAGSGGRGLSADARCDYVFGASVEGLDTADLVVVVGSNPRVEAPVLNARIRGAALAGARVLVIGPEGLDLTYAYEALGDGPGALAAAADSKELAQRLQAAERPVVLAGAALFDRADAAEVADGLRRLVEAGRVVRPGHDGFSVLHHAASRAGALDVGFVPGPGARSNEEPSFVYLLGADDFDADDVPEGAFVVYQGHHGDRGAARADVVLPGAAYTEKFGTYVNTEGRAQTTKPAVSPPGRAREDWKILRALSEAAGAPLPVESLDDVRARLEEVAPHLGRRNHVEAPLQGLRAPLGPAAAGADAPASFASPLLNFYQTDAVSRASRTMARCMRSMQNPLPGVTGPEEAYA